MNKKIGAALVVGGGVGGMQAALDLAESGIKVYLIENKPCIGGVMAQLDKTFPTNDCAMCTLAPRLVEVGRHKDIEIITLADLDKIEGKPGNFTVSIKKKARYIKEDKCNGCGECTEKCPIETMSEFNTNLTKQKAIYRLYPQAIPNTFAIKKLGQSPCRFACPAGQRVQGYVALIKRKRYEDAYRVIKRDNLFPSICGRICNHRCEDDCTRGKVDQPVSIMALKKFVADWAFDNKIKITNSDDGPKPSRNKKIAVIGAGPAGLTAAYDLKELGYKLVVYESLPELGGMMRYGVPNFRLPLDRLRWDIENVLDGIEVKTNTRVNDVAELITQGFNAVFIATGAHVGKKLNIPGKDHKEVLLNTDFLRMFAMNEPLKVKKRVLVLGGGNVAMDVARTALRLGAEKVEISCLESREQMPAHTWEIEDAEKEGIVIHPGRSFKEIVIQNDEVKGIRCVKVDFHGFDDKGMPIMDVIADSEHIIEADTVVFAIGQRPDSSFLNGKIELTAFGTIKVDSQTLETSQKGIFAGGDAITGTQFVVDAIAAGHKAAISIHRYLNGEPLNQTELPEKKVELSYEEIEEKLKQISGNGEKVVSTPINPDTALDEETAIKEASRCLECGICSECLLCADTCKAGAIEHLMPEETIREFNVGAVILAPGYDLYEAKTKLEYSYAISPNVVTALEFERILSASGPYTGQVLRPSDNEHPKHIAFIQCVGSRDDEHNYCSSICCMYATKEAIIAMEHSPGLKCTIFYMDLRAYGKGFDEYYERAKQLGVRYIRCRPSSVKEISETNNLIVQYQSADDTIISEEFDIVILSNGLRPTADTLRLSEKLGLDLNQFGFCQTSTFDPLATNHAGVFACGPFTEPKDIPETVTQASAAAGNALSILADARNTMIVKKEFPPEKDVTGQEARIGVFVCHCGRNIGGVVNVPEVVEYAKSLSNVVYAEHNLYTCSTDTQDRIKTAINEHNLNRIVVASCTPRTHEVLFRQTIREAGLNYYLFEMTNIRDQCSWVHMQMPEESTRKSKDLLRMSVAKARLIEPLKKRTLSINNSALIIGGGLSGMTAALNLASQGFDVHLVEKDKEFGGHLRHIHYLLDGENPQKKLNELTEKVVKHPKIHSYLSSEVSEVDGFVGNFKSKIKNGKEETKEIEHGAVIVATGAHEYQPIEYLYGKDQRVITQHELEELIEKGNEKDKKHLLSDISHLSSVVMIQCVGSRDDNNAYCSRICCSQAIKNALKLKTLYPNIEIFILYRDIRTYGFKEEFYTKARLLGIKFIRYEPEKKPEVAVIDGRLVISIDDPILNANLKVDCDMLVLSPAIVPREDGSTIAQMLKVPLNQNGFFLEVHMKLRPIDFATEGIFLCGLAHAPKMIDESIAQALGCASRAATILSKDKIELDATISEVIDANCDGCAYCIDPCPYKALTLIEYMKNGDIKKTVETNEAVCKGCGICQATCPKKGIFVRNFRLEQLSAMVDAALMG